MRWDSQWVGKGIERKAEKERKSSRFMMERLPSFLPSAPFLRGNPFVGHGYFLMACNLHPADLDLGEPRQRQRPINLSTFEWEVLSLSALRHLLLSALCLTYPTSLMRDRSWQIWARIKVLCPTSGLGGGLQKVSKGKEGDFHLFWRILGFTRIF